MLNEVDLVHVTSRNRPSHLVDRCLILDSRPGLLPGADGTVLGDELAGSLGRPHTACGKRERGTRLGRRRPDAPPDGLREPVAEVQVRDELLVSRREEALRVEPVLDPLEGITRFAELEYFLGHARDPAAVSANAR